MYKRQGYAPCERHQALLSASFIAAVVTTASRRPAAVHARPRAGMDRESSRQRSKVPMPIPTSRATTSIAALSGGNNRATALLLNVCPYRATSVLHRHPLGWSMEATTILTRGGGFPSHRPPRGPCRFRPVSFTLASTNTICLGPSPFRSMADATAKRSASA